MLFLLKNWKLFAMGGVALAIAATIGVQRMQISNLREDVETAQKNEALARQAAATERANADALNERLQAAQAEAERAIAARDAAQEARDEALANVEIRETVLTETITIEREADATLDQCLAYELPDSILRQLPE